MTSLQDTQEALSIQFWHWLESKRVFQKFFIFLIIWGVPPPSRQTQWKFHNKRGHNFWLTWPLQKKKKNSGGTFIYELEFAVDHAIRHHVNRSKTFKIKEFIIYQSRGQCPRYSGTCIYTLYLYTFSIV